MASNMVTIIDIIAGVRINFMKTTYDDVTLLSSVVARA